ncbi:MAG: hypothetical protein OEY33_00115 [Bdellovibrionales bacterium]|nr:hypothetical protein [Bdellovibrionales bacterium]
MRKNLILLSLFLLTGCSEFATIGVKKHQFNAVPRKIVWIQLAGFSIEHLAMLRFSRVSSKKLSSFEKMTCMGSMWNYDLYNLRPDDESNFLSQITGKQNIKKTCEDYKLTPLWRRLSNLGYKVGILENNVKEENSLTDSLKCEETNFLNGSFYWKMSKAEKGSDQFHYLKKKEYEVNKVYYDLSCQNRGCETSLSNNFKSLYTQFSDREPSLLFLLRDFSYKESLKEGNFKEAIEILNEVSTIIDYLEKKETNENLLIVLSSAEPFSFEYPKSGKDWESFERSGKKVIYRQSLLSSPVLATGAGAENFCGIYEQWEIHPRFLWRPKKIIVPLLDIFEEKTEIKR